MYHGSFKFVYLWIVFIEGDVRIGVENFVVSDKRLSYKVGTKFKFESNYLLVMQMLLCNNFWENQLGSSQTYECTRYSTKDANQFHLLVHFKPFVLHYDNIFFLLYITL